MKALMSLAEAAAETPYSVKTLRKAVQTTDPKSFPPPLQAKRGARGSYAITDEALRDWIASLPNA